MLHAVQLKAQHFKVRVSNPRIMAYLNLKVLSNIQSPTVWLVSILNMQELSVQGGIPKGRHKTMPVSEDFSVRDLIGRIGLRLSHLSHGGQPKSHTSMQTHSTKRNTSHTAIRVTPEYKSHLKNHTSRVIPKSHTSIQVTPQYKHIQT